MPKPIELSAVFGLEPEAIVKAFETKGYSFSWDWTDTWQEAHAKAFTVAKAMKMDILQDIHNGIQDAIKTGKTEAEFKKSLTPLLQAKGWWGRVPAKDVPTESPLPSGVDPEKEVQLGSPRRLRTIYQTNLQVAYSVGRWKSMKENSAIRPFWGWVSLLDHRTRLSHRLLDYTVSGKVFPHDDPFWQKFYPPIDWGCRCRIRAFREDELKARGLKPTSGDQLIKIEKVPLKETESAGPQTEIAVYMGAKQAVRTGKGWGYPKGEGYYQPDLEKYDYHVARQYVHGVLTGPDLELNYTRIKNKIKKLQDEGNETNQILIQLQKTESPEKYWPVAILDDTLLKLLKTDIRTVRLSSETLVKQIVKHESEGIKIEHYPLIQPSIESSRLIVKEGDVTYLFYSKGKSDFYSVLKKTKSGKAMFLQSFRKTTQEEVDRMKKRGEVIYEN